MDVLGRYPSARRARRIAAAEDLFHESRVEVRELQELSLLCKCAVGEEYLGMLREAGFDRVTIAKDIDSLATAGDTLDDPVAETIRKNGLTMADIAGKVRSITFTAVKA